MRGYITAMSTYASFRGRESRSKFWQFVIIAWLASMASMAGASDIELEVRSHLDSKLFDRDPLIGAIEVTNVGGPVTLTNVTINREQCRLSFFEIVDPNNPSRSVLNGLPSYFAFDEEQRQKFSEKLADGVNLNRIEISLDTGDSVVFTAPSVGNSPVYLGFKLDTKLETGTCGRVLVNMTLHSTDGDLFFEW
jgi:hypothetical protein